MAFIDKKDPVVLNIKLTSKGRENLSKGHLHFKYFAIGDSEIDYQFISGSSINPFGSKILRPADRNPDIISFVTRNFLTEDNLISEEQYNEITNVPSITWNVENTVDSIGFFTKNNGDFVFRITSEYLKQPDAMIMSDEVTGGTKLKLFRAPTYGTNVNEPEVDDYILIRWVTNESGFDTTGYTINKNNPTPALFYKITEVSGLLSDDSIVITVDRELPNFNNSGSALGSAIIFYSSVELNVEEEFSTDYASDALLSFLQNCQCSTIIFPFWKLSIIFTDNIAGVQLGDKQFGQYNTNVLGGFVSYIQNQEPTIKKLGVIHYTNVSPANAYGEQLLLNTPTLQIPTIMWHKSTGTTMGLTLKATGVVKTITGVTTSLNTRYYDLADLYGNAVGKVFIDLKVFVIEDQELLFAMSYKSNRSWTLPNYTVGVNDTIIINCP